MFKKIIVSVLIVLIVCTSALSVSAENIKSKPFKEYSNNGQPYTNVIIVNDVNTGNSLLYGTDYYMFGNQANNAYWFLNVPTSIQKGTVITLTFDGYYASYTSGYDFVLYNSIEGRVDNVGGIDNVDSVIVNASTFNYRSFSYSYTATRTVDDFSLKFFTGTGRELYIKNISYTIDNTQAIINNQNENTDREISNNNSNTDKQIAAEKENTDKITSTIESENQKEKDDASSTGADGVGSAEEALGTTGNFDSAGSGFQKLANAMTSTSRTCVFPLPEIYIPAIEGVCDKIVLFDKYTQVTFSPNSIFGKSIPKDILDLIRSITTICLILFCLYEFWEVLTSLVEPGARIKKGVDSIE